MPEGRLVKKKISNSVRVNSMPEGAQLLYTWMITHLDRDGRMRGEPRYIKNVVMPLKRCSVSQVDKWLNIMASLKSDTTGYGLIERYEVNGNKYLWMPGFEGEQGQGKHGNQPAWYARERPSDLPPPPDQPQKAEPKEKPKFDKSMVVDDVYAEMIDIYENNLGVLSGPLADRLKDIRDNYPIEHFKAAIEEALVHNKRNLRYVEVILERWKLEGFKTGDRKEKVAAGKQANYRKLEKGETL